MLKIKPGMMANICNPITQDLKQEDHEFKTGLGKTDPISKTNYNFKNSWREGAGGIMTQSLYAHMNKGNF
jgi:hypothetical protein